MIYQSFGRRTGLRVSEYALGTANFGTGCGDSQQAARLIWGQRGDGAEPAQAHAIFERFAEAGGTLIDTADCYQFGRSEELVGEFVGAQRDHFVLSSKYTNGQSSRPTISATGNSRKTMIRSLEASLKRLNTDYLDLFWVHFPDPLTPIEEILAGFDDLVRSGKILAAGLSNFPAWRVARAATIAELRGSAPIVGLQTEYSLTARTAERELLPMAESLGLAVAAWSPLGGGLLTGRYRRTTEGWTADGNRRVIRSGPDQGDARAAVLAVVQSIAGQTGRSPAQVSISWLRARAQASGTPLVPIIGPRTMDQLDDYLAALDLDLTDQQLAALDQVSAVPLGAPHEVNDVALPAVLGGEPGAVVRPVVPVG